MNKSNDKIYDKMFVIVPILLAIIGLLVEPNRFDLLYLLFVAILGAKYLFGSRKEGKKLP